MTRVTIYIQLLNEGLVAARPVEAERIGSAAYEILLPSDYNPENEEWEFLPGDVVRCNHVNWGEGKNLLLAVEKVSTADAVRRYE